MRQPASASDLEHRSRSPTAWARQRVGGAALAIAAITTVVVLLTWPQALLVSTRVGPHTDALFSVWRLAWIADSLVSADRAVFDAPIFFPHQDTLAYSDAILLSGALTAPFRWLGASPFAVYNVYLLLAYVVTGFAAALLCHRLTGDWMAAAIGGVIFTTSPYRMDHFERLELITSFGIPLAFFCWHRAVQTRSRVWFAFAFLCIALQWYVGMYQALFLATVLPCLVVDWSALDPNLRRRAFNAAAVGALLSVVLIAPSTLPYLRARQDVGERATTEVAEYSGELDDFLAVHTRNVLYGKYLSQYGAPERNFFPGVTPLVLAAAGLMLAPRKTTLLYGLVLVMAVELTLGTNGVVFPVFREFLAPYRGLRAPARAAVLVLLPLAVFACYGVAGLMSRVRPGRRPIILAVLLVFLTLESWMHLDLWKVPTSTLPWTAPEGAVVVDYPLPRPSRLDVNFDGHYMVARIGMWPRTLNGYSGHYPPSYIALLEETVDFPAHPGVRAMGRHGATHVAVHEAWLEERYRAVVEALLPQDELALVGRYTEDGGEVVVFEILR